jgi:hypothetical protein
VGSQRGSAAFFHATSLGSIGTPGRGAKRQRSPLARSLARPVLREPDLFSNLDHRDPSPPSAESVAEAASSPKASAARCASSRSAALQQPTHTQDAARSHRGVDLLGPRRQLFDRRYYGLAAAPRGFLDIRDRHQLREHSFAQAISKLIERGRIPFRGLTPRQRAYSL